MSGTKRLPDIEVNGWQDLIKKPVTQVPEGYSNVTEIAQKTGFSRRYISEKLKAADKEGRIQSIRVLVNGHTTVYYKDGVK